MALATDADARVSGLSHDSKPTPSRISLTKALAELTLLLLFGGLLSSCVLEYVARRYLLPQIELHEYQYKRQLKETHPKFEYTYYQRTCSVSDVSAESLEELRADQLSTKGASKLFQTHGVITFDNLLSRETATQLRQFILDENEKKEDFTPVPQQDKRKFDLKSLINTGLWSVQGF
jgi:hypothetical protein